MSDLGLERQKTVNSIGSNIDRAVTVLSVKQDEQTIKEYQDKIYASAKPNFSSKAIKNYIITRFTDLKPSKETIEANKRLLNPLPGLRQIGRQQWCMILVAFWSWSWDAYDFFTISLSVTQLAKDLDQDVKNITWGITLVLMLRSVGALIFGYLGDRYGRRGPLAINMFLVCILKIGTGFVKTYPQFLGVRALFGILLGGVYGNATALALDDCPVDARGIISGFVQQGYAFGYLLAVVFKRAIGDNTHYHWKAMYWFGAGICFLIVVAILLLPDTKAYQRQKEINRFNKEHNIQQLSFGQKAVRAWKSYWLMIIYMVLLMSGFNFMSHGSQDLYPTLLTVRYDFSNDRSTVTNCVANLGAFAGGIFVGHMSNFTGRRLSIMACCVVGGALIYPWAFVSTSAINAGAFFLQFCVQGAWGVIPVHLSELSPPSFRSFVVGVSYQLGNLVSSASSTIETTIGERFPMISPSGESIYDYAKVMAIFMGAVFAFVLLVTFVGPENMNASFEMVEGYDDDQDLQRMLTDEMQKVDVHHDEEADPNGSLRGESDEKPVIAAEAEVRGGSSESASNSKL
ncbi:DEKNAAC102974 [Brettanomyces naardenensis]|uniref:DEKNAAC102974 n=1 Tax=Brettanomyces naardenensis TaxID=13370 RepID=A0A448YM16_BRENA|nr:DEKNAAC102974 [Brettanomyces naardenensis]